MTSHAFRRCLPGQPGSSARVVAWIGLLVAGCAVGGIDTASVSSASGEAIERTAEKGPVKMVVRVTPREPRLSDLLEMEIVVTAQPQVQIVTPAFGQAVGDFLVRDYSERSATQSKANSNEETTRRFVYKLEPVHAGLHLIRSIAIEFIDNRPTSEQKGIKALIESDPLEVNVTSELGDQVPNLADLEPMIAPRPLDQSSRSVWWWVLAAVGVLAAVVIWLRRRRRGTAYEPAPPSPEEVANAALAALLSENLPGRGLYQEFYLRLTGIVRHFIEGTTGLRAPEQTTEEFLSAMHSRDLFSADRSLRLKEFLEAADMVKYAGQQPDPQQIELSILRAREFVTDRSLTATVHSDSRRPAELQRLS